MSRPRAFLLGQAVVSVLVLALLWADAGPERVAAALSGVDPLWALGACAAQGVGLVLRATRVWTALGRVAPWGQVVRGALAANLGHLVVPSRLADVAGAAAIARRAGLPLERGLAAYATAALLEAAAYGTVLITLLFAGAPVVERVLTGAQRREALGWVTVATLGGIAAAAVAIRMFRSAGSGGGGASPPATPPRDVESGASSGARAYAGLRARLGRAADQSYGILASPASLVLNLALGAAQIGVMLVVFRCGLAAVGATVSAPWLCGALVMAVGAIGGMVLPPHFGANTSAAATFVLTPFGATAPEALAFGGVLWFSAAAPDVVLGLVAVWVGRR